MCIAELPRLPRRSVPGHQRVRDAPVCAHVARPPGLPRAGHLAASRRQQQHTGEDSLLVHPR